MNNNTIREQWALDRLNFRKPSFETSEATRTLNNSQTGAQYVFQKVDGTTVTLPTGSDAHVGTFFDFVVKATITSNGYKIITGSASEFLIGGYTSVDTDSSNAMAYFSGDGATHVAINMTSASTNAKGGMVGTRLRFTKVSSTQWMVEGVVHCAGTPSTAFATS